MTREEAKYMSEVLKAYSKGKTIQYKVKNEWVDISDLFITPNFVDKPTDYRIKPEPKVRPYNWGEFQKALKEHGGYIHLKNSECRHCIDYYDYSNVRTYSHGKMSYIELLDKFTWADDDSPCGIIEE